MVGLSAMHLVGLATFGPPLVSVPVLATVGLLAQLSVAVMSINRTSLIQQLVPTHALGWVAATQQVVVLAAVPVGATLGGLIGDIIGLRATLAIAARLAGEQGTCLTRLGQPAEAQAVLRSAIATLDSNQGKSRSRLLSALGIACAQNGDVDEACRIGAEALDLAIGMAVQPNLRDVFRLRQALEPWRSTDLVRAFDDRLGVVA